MTAAKAAEWAAVINILVGLAVPITAIVKLIKESLSPEDANVVLLQVHQAWVAAQAENDARIEELRKQLGQ